MTSLTRATFRGLMAEVRILTNPRLLLWLVAAGVLIAPLVLLTIAIDDGSVPSTDQTVLDWVVGRDLPLLEGFSQNISAATSRYPLMAVGVAGMVFLWLLGMTRAALVFAFVGGVIGIVAYGSDLTLGELVGRSRPLDVSSETSFPSGHVFGSTVLFGMAAWLAIYYRLNKKLLVPLLGILLALTLAVGFSRMFEQAHWPSDVAAGYLLAGFWILVLSTSLAYIRKVSWLSSPKQATEMEVLDCESCRVESSIASTVVLDPERGTATKVYKPPGVVRLIYWLAFQASFPYEHNRAALDAATYRRRIASALTVHRFGKDLVAHVTSVNCGYGPCSFVTEFIPGEKVENDERARKFLGQVVETFADARLSVWQVNPGNPHAHTNLIRTSDGDSIIIDLESAVVTPIPAPGQWRSALRRGTIPVFDDIDFGRLRDYINTNEAALEESLGRDGLAELRGNADSCEQAIRTWQDSEPRVWGRLIRGVYRLLDWKRFFNRIDHALCKADGAAEQFLAGGISRWEAEGRLSPSEIQWLRSYLTSDEVQEPLHHLGVHLVLSVALFLPIPGLRSLARFVWTLAFWVKAQGKRFRRRVPASEGKATNVHTPLVMVLALIPGFGAVAYLASRPLRRRLLIRLMLDQSAVKLPFRLYERLHLARRLAPT